MKTILLLLICSYFVIEDYRYHFLISALIFILIMRYFIFYMMKINKMKNNIKEKFKNNKKNKKNKKCKDFSKNTVNYTNDEYIEGVKTIDKFRDNMDFNKNHFSQIKMNNILKNNSTIENFIPRDYYDETVTMNFDKYFENNSYTNIKGI